jgi:UDP-N-acetylglucosamine 4-epimerase
MVDLLKHYLSKYDPEIQHVEITYGPNRNGDIPHSKASIEKAKRLLNYNPKYPFADGLKEAVDWYWNNLTK